MPEQEPGSGNGRHKSDGAPQAQEGTPVDTARELEDAIARLQKDGPRGFQGLISVEVAEFFVSLLDLPESPSVLLPRNETGIVPYVIRRHHPKARFTFYSDDPKIRDNLASLYPNERVLGPNSLVELAINEAGRFDLILGYLEQAISFATFDGGGATEGVSRLRRKEPNCGYEEERMFSAVSHLLNNGGVLIADWRHFDQSGILSDGHGHKYDWAGKFRDLTGLAIKAVIEDVPVGLGESWFAEKHFVLGSRGDQHKIFSARYSDVGEHRKAISGNFRNRSQGNRVETGYWSDLENFHSNETLRRREAARDLATANGLREYKFREIIRKMTDRVSPDAENALYIKVWVEPDHPYLPVPTMALHPTDNCRWFEVWIDPEKALAEYVMEFFAQSHVGRQLVIDLVHIFDVPEGLVTPRSIAECALYLPSKEVQRNVIRQHGRLASLAGEIDDLNAYLWSEPSRVAEIGNLAETINRDDSFGHWLDLLPFPLASVLWSYHADSKTPKERYENLLAFFEVCAEFLCIVHLSALASDIDRWKRVRKGLESQIEGGHLKIKMPSFWHWLTLFDHMAKFALTGLKDEKTRRDLLGAYCAATPSAVEQLSRKPVISALKSANAIRNTWKGHAGAVGDELANEIHDKLHYLLQEIREPITGLGEHYRLVLPESGRYVRDEFIYSARVIEGNRTSFERSEISTSHPLEDGFLYLLGKDTRRAIKLRPLMQFVPGPKTKIDACYFYNRVEQGTGTARFVSYHFARDSELSQTIEDELEATLRLFDPE